jgi:hypothetical protein
MRTKLWLALLLLASVLGAQTTYQIGTTPFTTYGATDGCPVFQTVSGNPNTAWWYNGGQNGGSATPYDGAVRFPVVGGGGAGSITIAVLAYQTANALALYEDPTATSDGTLKATSGTLAQDGTFKTTSFASLDPGHTYEILSYLIPSGGATANGIASVTITGGTIGGTATFKRPCGALYGDSIVAYSNIEASAAVDIRETYYPAFLAAGYSLLRAGAGGQKVVTWGELSSSAVTNATPTLPTLVVHALGVNDQQAWVNAGSITTFQAGVVTELQNMAAGVAAGAKMLWQQVLPNAAAQSAERGPYNTAIIAAVAAYNASPTNGITACSYSTDSWVNTTTDMNGDGLHPVVSNAPSSGVPFGTPLIGYGKIANNMSFILAGYQSASYALTGPASGTVGLAATFTIAPTVSGAVFGPDWTATPSDSGAGGTFSPSTVTLTAGAASATFTYTPAAIGAKGITLGSLADCQAAPGSLTYTATGVSSSYRTAAVSASGATIQ